MNFRRKYPVVSFLAILALPLFIGSTRVQPAAAPGKRPNIIIIMADDMGFSDIGCYGSEIETPNLDWLAANGLRFTQFYNAGRCCPTRASLLTGVYPHQAGMGDMVTQAGRTPTSGPYQGYLSRNTVTIAEALKAAGYQTYMSGKWHVGEDSIHWPLQRGFDKYYGLISGANSYFELLPGRVLAEGNVPFAPADSNFYFTDALTAKAVQYLDQGHASGKPFFLYLAYTAPHWPMHARPEDIARYRGKYLQGWDSLREDRYRKLIQSGIADRSWQLSPRDTANPAWAGVADKDSWDLRMAVYAAMMHRMDQGIGQLIQKLRETGELENTLIMFLSDNGGCHENIDGRMDRDLGEAAARIARNRQPGEKGSYTTYEREWANASNTPFRLYKHWMHEGGIATPFIAYWPRQIRKGNTITRAVAHVFDLMPTCLEAAGASYPRTYGGHSVTPVEGISLVNLLAGKKWAGHEALFWEHEKNRAVRKGKWKLVAAGNGQWELYDLENDRTELNDVSRQHPGIVAELQQLFQAWAVKVGV